MRLNLSHPMRTLLGIVLLVLLATAILVAGFYVLPTMWGGSSGGEEMIAQQEAPDATPTIHPWAFEPVRTPHPWAIGPFSQEASAPAAPTSPPGQPTLPPEGGTTSGGPAGTSLPRGSGEQLPLTSSGIPWLIPVGLLLLAIVVWWRWRRLQVTD